MFDVWLPLLGGFALLLVGGEFLVRGAVRVAASLGVSPLVIGLTLVGFGTSTPELVTSARAALTGAPGIAYGNIVGSNIANVLLIVGVAALIGPIAITSSALKRDGTVMLVASVAFAALVVTGPAGRVVGLAFVLGLVAYIVLTFRQERASDDHGAVYDKSMALQEVDTALASDVPDGGPLAPSILIASAGLLSVVLGGGLLVDGAVALARGMGVSETVIGLTIVAVGTSMPELVTSVVAGLKGQGDVAFGNVVGSNIYNVLGIGGATALVAPHGIPGEILRFDLPVMIGVSAVLVVFARTDLRIARWEGAVLLAGYVAYVVTTWP